MLLAYFVARGPDNRRERFPRRIFSRTAMDENTSQARELVKSDDGVQGLVVGNTVYDPLLFAPKQIKFTAQQYVFLRHYRLGVSIEEAAGKSGLTPDDAVLFLNRPKTREWLEDRALKDHIKNEWEEPGKWYKEGEDVLQGRKEYNKIKLEIWKAFGERVAPVKRQERETQEQPKIVINIDPTAVQEAFRRQSAIEAEIVKEHS